MKVVVPISAVLWVAAMTFAAYPIIFWSLALPNVVVTILMIRVDARIEPYWKRRSGDAS